MNYRETEKRLVERFEVGGFRERLQNREFNSRAVVVPVINQRSEIKICFPGYKSKLENGRVTYDYRVDVYNEFVNGSAISHANIIVDVYAKASARPELERDLYDFFLALASDGRSADLKGFRPLRQISWGGVGEGLKQRAEEIHTILQKHYNRQGNAWGYSLEELYDFITWIVLQEDINYPMPNRQGRRMPFCRYLEAVYCAVHEEGHQLEEVISRALSHSIPPRWTDAPGLPYDAVDAIANAAGF